MAILVDSYSETNYVSNTSSTVGQSFTGNGGVLDSCKFYLQRYGSPSGNVYAKLYAHSGTFGSTGIPTGSPLAISDPVSASTIPTSFSLVTFTFSGSNRVNLVNGTKYFIVFETSFSYPNYILCGYDSTSPTHPGNYAWYSGGWYYDASRDLCFYVYSESGSPPPPPPPPPPPESQLPTSGVVPFSGIKIAKAGVNALATNDPQFLKYSSDFGTLKYYARAETKVTINAGNGDVAGKAEIIHNLGYYPFVEVFVSVYIGSPTGIYEYVPFAGSGATVQYDATYSITPTKIILYSQINGVSSSLWNFDFVVFVFKNNLGL